MNTEQNQGEETLPFIEALIEGNIDADGFYKITSGITSESKWSVLIHHSSMGNVSKPALNSGYEWLGPLQIIPLKPDGIWKRDKDAPVQPIEEFFRVLKDEKPATVSPTSAYKVLGITK